MARIVAVKEYLEKALKDETKPWTKMFALAEEKTGVDRLYIFVGKSSGWLCEFPVIPIDWRDGHLDNYSGTC